MGVLIHGGLGYWGKKLARIFEVFKEEVFIKDNYLGGGIYSEKGLGDKSSFTMDIRIRGVDPDRLVDKWIIATPPETHYKIAMEGLRKGKHVLIEKPMTMSALEADRLVREAGERNLVLMVDHTYIYSLYIQAIKSIIDSGDLGEVYYYDSERVNLGIFQDCGVVWDLAPHDLSIFKYLFDFKYPLEIRAEGGSLSGRTKQLDYAHIFLQKIGLTAHFHISWLSALKLRRILIVGSEKTLVYDDSETDVKIKIIKSDILNKNAQLQRRTGEVYSPPIMEFEPLSEMARDFIHCCNTGDKPLSSGEDGLFTVRCINAINNSISTKRSNKVWI